MPFMGAGGNTTKVQGNYFLMVPPEQEKCWGYNIGTLTPVRFLLCRVELRARLLPSACPQWAGFMR